MLLESCQMLELGLTRPPEANLPLECVCVCVSVCDEWRTRSLWTLSPSRKLCAGDAVCS